MSLWVGLVALARPGGMPAESPGFGTPHYTALGWILPLARAEKTYFEYSWCPAMLCKNNLTTSEANEILISLF